MGVSLTRPLILGSPQGRPVCPRGLLVASVKVAAPHSRVHRAQRPVRSVVAGGDAPSQPEQLVVMPPLGGGLSLNLVLSSGAGDGAG